MPNQSASRGILFVLKTGIRWADLPKEMGCGSGMTCCRRLQEWHDLGVLGRHRWVVERTFAWFRHFKRLTVRYERRADIHLAFVTLAACSFRAGPRAAS